MQSTAPKTTSDTSTTLDSWWEAEMVVESQLSEDVGACLIAAGAAGVEIVADAKDAPPEDKIPLFERPQPPPGFDLLIASYDAELSESDVSNFARQGAADMWQAPSIIVSKRRDGSWMDRWKTYFKPLKLGKKFRIIPKWESEDAAQDSPYAIFIDPGMAFGTGQHATTALCTEVLEELFDSEQAPDSLLDIGCGSGILSFAAAHLGVKSILGVDNDPLAVKAATENLDLNPYAVGIAKFSDEDAGKMSTRYPFVVANILAHILISISDDVSARVESGGQLLLSGLLHSQQSDVLEAYQASAAKLYSTSFEVVALRRRGEWTGLLLRLNS